MSSSAGHYLVQVSKGTNAITLHSKYSGNIHPAYEIRVESSMSALLYPSSSPRDPDHCTHGSSKLSLMGHPGPSRHSLMHHHPHETFTHGSPDISLASDHTAPRCPTWRRHRSVVYYYSNSPCRTCGQRRRTLKKQSDYKRTMINKNAINVLEICL